MTIGPTKNLTDSPALILGSSLELCAEARASSRGEPSLKQLRRWINFVIATEEAASPEGDGKDQVGA